MAIDPKDLGELQRALNDAASKASVLWTTFVIFQLYVAIAFGSVTHRDLFLEKPITLPVLNVALPLVGFFVVAPALLVIFHLYLFLHLRALAIKAKAYNSLLLEELPVASDRQYLRQRLDSFVILQFLAGPKDQRGGFGGLWLRLIAWITLVGTPVLVLLQGQLTFLPYHREWIVWLQRVAVLIDLAVIWYFWSQLRTEDDSTLIGRLSRKAWIYLGGALSLSAFIFSALLATFPGEWLNENLPELHYVPTNWPPRWLEPSDWTSLHVLLFEGVVDEVTSRPRSAFSNRLVLVDQSFVSDPDKLDGLPFRGRDLNQAVLSRADLRKADFTGAMLNGAKLDGAKLQAARFLCAATAAGQQKTYTAESEKPRCTSLQGAELSEAKLQGASLFKAQLQGASLAGAELQGADLSYAQLQGANFSGARLQLAMLLNAELQGARLNYAELQGALLLFADLQGASLDKAHLQGTVLSQANLQGASLRNAKLWRAQGAGSKLEFSDLQDFDVEEKPQETHESFIEWRDEIVKLAGSRLIKPLERLDPEAQNQTVDDSAVWKTAWSMQPKGEEGERKRSEFLATIACSSPGPHVARGLAWRLVMERFDRRNDVGGLQRDREVTGHQFFVDQLRKGKLDPAGCPGVKGFANPDWLLLYILTAS